MKKIIISIFAVALFGISQLSAFTGIIRFEAENFEAKEKSSMTLYMKGQRCRLDYQSSFEGGSSNYTLYISNTSSDLIMVSGGQRLSIPVATITSNKYFENILLASYTGKTKTVAGDETREVMLKGMNASITCYVSPIAIELPLILKMQGLNAALAQNNIEGTPYEIYAKDLSGKELFYQKIISVEAVDVSDSMVQE